MANFSNSAQEGSSVTLGWLRSLYETQTQVFNECISETEVLQHILFIQSLNFVLFFLPVSIGFH